MPSSVESKAKLCLPRVVSVMLTRGELAQRQVSVLPGAPLASGLMYSDCSEVRALVTKMRGHTVEISCSITSKTTGTRLHGKMAGRIPDSSEHVLKKYYILILNDIGKYGIPVIEALLGCGCERGGF